MYLVGVIFFRDEVNDSLNELGGGGGVGGLWVVQCHPGVCYLLHQNRVQLSSHLLQCVCVMEKEGSWCYNLQG